MKRYLKFFSAGLAIGLVAALYFRSKWQAYEDMFAEADRQTEEMLRRSEAFKRYASRHLSTEEKIDEAMYLAEQELDEDSWEDFFADYGIDPDEFE